MNISLDFRIREHFVDHDDVVLASVLLDAFCISYTVLVLSYTAQEKYDIRNIAYFSFIYIIIYYKGTQQASKH